MSNCKDQQGKILVRLTELYKKHRTLDSDIKEMYSRFERDELINRKKTEKLWLKDEIHRLESQLKAIE